jgi:hypothetical protein
MSQVAPTPVTREAAQKRLRLPAVAILVLSGLTLAGMVIGLLFQALDGKSDVEAQREALEWLQQLEIFEDVDPASIEHMAEVASQVDLVASAITFLLCLTSIAGAIAMLRVRSEALAMAGAIACLIPCCGANSCCCFLAIPIGIWALVVVQHDDVQRAFDLP